MPEHDINSDNPLEMVWAVREKIYEEIKDMTAEERMAHMSRQADEFRRSIQEINSGDYDLSFLHTKVRNDK
jgi:hypothetical protein